MRRLLSLAALGVFPAILTAQADCFPGPNSNEAKTFALLSVPLAFTGARAPAVPAHGIGVGLEVASITVVDSATATPTVCRPGKGPENTDAVPVVVRLRFAAAVQGFLLELSWIPPVGVNGVKSNLIGVAIAHPFTLSAKWVLGVRAEGVFGSIHAPIVCDEAAVSDPASECFGGTISNDTWQPGIFGVEAVVGGGGGKVRPHLGLGYTHLSPRFQVNFTNAQGETDNRKVEVDLNRAAVFGGVSVPLGPLLLTGEAYATIGDAVIGRMVLRLPLSK